MDRSVKLISIERKQQQLRPVHVSPTKVTRNPNSPVKSSSDEENQKEHRTVLPKGKETHEVVKRDEHTEIVCKRYHHKNSAEYDERRHVFKTDRNNFEITVKLKKPNKKETESDQLLLIQQLKEENKARKEQLAVLSSQLEKKKPSRHEVESAQLLLIQQLKEANKAQKDRIAVLNSKLERKKSSRRDAEAAQLLLVQELKDENSSQKSQIETLNSQLEKAQSELREYIETIKELYDMATVLKNENQNLLDKREQVVGVGEKLTSAIAENKLLKKHLAQLSQQHELILKPKDEELRKLKNIVTDVKATLEEEINELKSLPVTTSISSAAAAKCSSSSFFRNLNLTDEDRDRRSESLGTSISEIRTIDDDDDEFIHLAKTAPKTKTTNIRNKNQSQAHRKTERARGGGDECPSIDDDSSSTQYLYLLTNDKNRDFEKDEDLDGLRK